MEKQGTTILTVCDKGRIGSKLKLKEILKKKIFFFHSLHFLKVAIWPTNLYFKTTNGLRRGSVGSVLACCKEGTSSILGSAPQGRSFHWAFKQWGVGDRPQRMLMDNCIVMNVILWMYVYYKKKMKNKLKEWQPATKPLIWVLKGQ